MMVSQVSQTRGNANFENPLIWPIFEVLQSESMIWKVHTLSSRLNELGYMPDLDPSPGVDVFKRNFLIMNGLYQLQETLYPEKWLQVEAMNIVLSSCELTAPNERVGVDTTDPLREYYLNWANYEASEGEVQRLLNQFWQHYHDYVGRGPVLEMNKQKALELFKLPLEASYSDIRRRWRKLALKWHPDRENGNAEQFRVLCEAWHVLRHDHD